MDLRSRAVRWIAGAFGATAVALCGCGGGDRATWRVDELHAAAPLVGRHLPLSCDDCHRGEAYDQAPASCYGCHQGDFEHSAFDHSTVGSSTECGACHSPEGWSPAHFDHDGFGFPLAGHHAEISCVSCHIDNVWAGQPADCEACHWTRSEDDPWRLALGSHCIDCHTPGGWAGAPFDHLVKTGFALTGAHLTVACVQCHPGHDASNTAAACNACHASAAQSAAHPAFATDCASCHTTAAWSPSSLNHEPEFPIASGPHSGFGCTSCHTGASFAEFTCLTCHARAETDARHREVSGYSYASADCFRCHPRGRGEDQ